MKKIAIYYIATNAYIVFLDEFIKGLENFYPGIPKKVVLITNHKEDFSTKSGEEIEIKQEYIVHHYWPIPTLFKMFYMDMFFTEDCDYHFYFNSNFIVKKDLGLGDSFDMCFTLHYMSNKLPLYVLNYGNNNKCVVQPKSAQCYISREEIPQGAKYCQGGFFGGKTEKVKHLLSDINTMIKEDLKHNIIPIWHDETYLNKYLLKYYWYNNIIGDVKLISMYDYGELLDKDKFFDKFNLQ